MKSQVKFYPVGRSECLGANVMFSPTGKFVLTVEEINLITELDKSELKVKDKLGSIPREIVVPDVGLVIVETSPEIDDWLDCKTRRGAVSKLERNPSFVIVSLLLVPVFLYLFFNFAVPNMAVQFAKYVPESAIQVASNHSLYAMDKVLLEKSKVEFEKQEAFRKLWQKTISDLRLSDRAYKLHFRQSEKLGANAFALPDGTVVVTDELLELIENEHDILQAILLHELGHVEEMHSMRLISETLVTSLAIDYFFGDIGAVIEVFGGLANTVIQNQFSQKLEWEADNFALKQMDKLNLDRNNFAEAMERLAEKAPEHTSLDVWMNSHPLLKDRIKNAKKVD